MMYRIVVAGHLGDGFADGLSDVSRHRVIQHQIGRDTVLEGELVDQSQLHGLLDRLRGLGLEVTRFSTFDSGTKSDSTEPGGDPNNADHERSD